MRTLLMVAVMLAIPIGAGAQDTAADDTRRLRSSRGFVVAVIDADSREWQGRLLEVGRNAITVELDARPRTFELAQIKRVDAHGDRIWDGILKGAIFGAVIGGVLIGERAVASGAVSYGLIGLAMDALHSCNHTVYRTPAVSASVTVLSW